MEEKALYPGALATLEIRASELLSYYVNRRNFDFEAPMMLKIRKRINAAIEDYLRANIRPGCTQSDSPNYDYKANVYNGCDPPVETTAFGGVFQKCEGKSPEEKEKCKKYEHRNVLTGGISYYGCKIK